MAVHSQFLATARAVEAIYSGSYPQSVITGPGASHTARPRASTIPPPPPEPSEQDDEDDDDEDTDDDDEHDDDEQ